MNLIRFYKVTELPASPRPDALYFVRDTAGRTTLWVTDTHGVANQISAPSIPRITVSATAPEDPEIGDIWFDTSET